VRLTTAQIEPFLKAPDRRVRAVLIYGPDEGLVRERAERLIRTVLDDLHDPFRLGELSGDGLRQDPAALADEARALALTGGRRVVRVRPAGDQATPACRNLLAQGAFEALVVVEAGDLAPSSSLRRLFETSAGAAALPCYRDQARDLAGLIQRTLAEHRLEAEPDAQSFLIDHLGADRGVTRSELDKLVLYVSGPGGTAPEVRRRITLADAAAVIGDSAALGLDDLVDAVVLGDLVQVQRCLDRLLGEGEQPVRIVRALASHFVRLQRLGLQVAGGDPPQRVVEQARPPIHFRRRDKVTAALRCWAVPAAERALGELLEVEVRCKTTRYPAALICREALLAIARQQAAAGARRRG
jgi:DNA polymerase-3 subunit delta